MVNVVEIDVRRVAWLLNGIQHALIGTGGDGDATKLVSDELRLTSVEVAAQIPPSNRPSGEKRVRRSVNMFLFAPRVENLEGSKRRGAGVTWIAAGPKFLTGVRNDDYHGDSWGDASPLLNESRARGRRAPRFLQVGSRGRQKVRIINTTVVSSISKRMVEREKVAHVGRMKATFLAPAARLGHKGIPAWIMRHIVANNPKAILNLSGLANADHPTCEFGSTSRGVSNFVAKVRRAVDIRRKKLRIRLNLILAGYAKDINSERAPRRRVP